ncbi:MAG TPA: hypothetical protein VF432_05375 [Thermoanaerobaculia bacterium]
MKVRIILVCTLLLLAAVPTFALPQCAHCNEWNWCESSPGDYEWCSDWEGTCYTDPWKRCSPVWGASVASEWQVASIEIHRPSLDSITTEAPADVAAVDVRKSEPASKQ